MDTEVTNDLNEPGEIQFYGLTKDGQIVVLPKATYSAGAIRQYLEEQGENALHLELTFSETDYAYMTSAIDAELNDLDGDTLIPTYFVLPYHTLQPLFPHPSVDTDEEFVEWLDNWKTQTGGLAVGPFKLADAKANWPWPADAPQATV